MTNFRVGAERVRRDIRQGGQAASIRPRESGEVPVDTVDVLEGAAGDGATTLDGFPKNLQGVALRESMQPVGGDMKLHVIEAGPVDGKPVVLLHGFPEFWMAWKEQIPALAKAGHRVIVPDLRGYNLSGRAGSLAEYRASRVADDISALLSSLTPGRKAAIVGHDWGAGIAWVMAMRHANQVERLSVMAAGHPADYDFKKMGFEQLKKSWYVPLMGLPSPMPERILSANDFALLRNTFRSQGVPADVTEMFISRLRANPGALTPMIDYYRAAKKYPATTFPVVDVPVLAIHGDKDKETGKRLMTTSRKRAPNFELAEISGGHWLQMAPASAAKVNALLLDFLAA